MFITSNFPLVPIALFYFICAVVGIIGNFIMVMVFLRESKFKTPVNYLITLNCLADLFHVSGHFVFNWQLLIGEPSSQANCFFLLFHTVIGYCISGPLLLAIGIDRLISCRFPLTYRNLQLHENLYLMVHLIFPVLFTVILMGNSFQFLDYDTQIICMAPLAMPRRTFEYFTYLSNFINVTIVIVYLKTYLILRVYKESDAQRMKSVFKSIAWTVLFVLIGWTTVTIGNTIAFGVIKDRKLSEIVSIYSGIGVNVSCSVNVFVFYYINSDYRNAIRRLFGKKMMNEEASRSDITTNKRNMSVIGIRRDTLAF